AAHRLRPALRHGPAEEAGRAGLVRGRRIAGLLRRPGVAGLALLPILLRAGVLPRPGRGPGGKLPGTPRRHARRPQDRLGELLRPPLQPAVVQQRLPPGAPLPSLRALAAGAAPAPGDAAGEPAPG